MGSRGGDQSEERPRRALRGRAGRMKGGRGSGRASTGAVRLWGRHAVEAALKNPDRSHHKLWATREGIESLDGELPANFPVEYAQGADLARLVARDAPHQGLVLECSPLPDLFLADVLEGDPSRPLLILDQVTDPHNVGAIMRSAAAFDACAMGVHLLEGIRLLLCPSGLEDGVMVMLSNAECPGRTRRACALRSAGAGRTHGFTEGYADRGMTMAIRPFCPYHALLPLRADRVFGLPVDHKVGRRKAVPGLPLPTLVGRHRTD